MRLVDICLTACSLPHGFSAFFTPKNLKCFLKYGLREDASDTAIRASSTATGSRLLDSATRRAISPSKGS